MNETPAAAPADVKSFAVYYRKQMERNPFGEHGTDFKVLDFHYMGNHDADSVDGLFALLNGATETPNPLGSDQWQHLIRQGVTDHTSMSVGDVAVDRDTKEAFRCDSFGWTKLTTVEGMRR
jgi:hypothetical protein